MWISLTLDENGAADGDGGLRTDDGDDVLALLLVTDFLEKVFHDSDRAKIETNMLYGEIQKRG